MTETRRPVPLLLPALLLGLGLVLTLVGWVGLARAHAGITVEHRQQATPHGLMPVDVYQAPVPPAAVSPIAPAVIVVHGFAANKELMRPFGYYLARQGYRAYLVDVSGHGHNAALLQRTGAPDDITALIDNLVARGEAAPGRIALVGHSMGTYIVTEAARGDSRVAATVVFSTITADAQPGRPPAYLMLTAGRDLPNVLDAFHAVLGRVHQTPAATPKALADVLPPANAAAAAVAGVWIPGRNHITILYDRGALQAMVTWLNRTLPGPASGAAPAPAAGSASGATPAPTVGVPAAPTDPGRDLALGWDFTLLAGLALLFLALALWLSGWFRGYPLRGTAAPRPYLWPLLYLLAGLLAIGLASLFHPLSFLHLMLSDYQAFYLILMALFLEVARRLFRIPLMQSAHANLDAGAGGPALLYGAVLFALFFSLLAPALTLTLDNALPIPARLWRAAVLVPFVIAFFLIDENIKAAVQSQHGPWVALGLSLLSKGVIAATWVVALALPRAPFFLLIAMPVMLVIFVLMDVLTTFLFQWRHESMSLGLFKGLIFVWLLAVSFPLGTGF